MGGTRDHPGVPSCKKAKTSAVQKCKAETRTKSLPKKGQILPGNTIQQTFFCSNNENNSRNEEKHWLCVPLARPQTGISGRGLVRETAKRGKNCKIRGGGRWRYMTKERNKYMKMAQTDRSTRRAREKKGSAKSRQQIVPSLGDAGVGPSPPVLPLLALRGCELQQTHSEELLSKEESS